LPQGRIGRLVAQAQVGDPVRRRDCAGPGIQVPEFPAGDRAVCGRAGTNVDDRRRANVTPRELLGVSPADPDRPPDRASKPRGGDAGTRAVLAAEAP